MAGIVRMMTGLPASGKTTLATKLVTESRGRLVRVNLDDFRTMLYPGAQSAGNWRDIHENLASELQNRSILAILAAGLDVVVDNTHLTPRGPQRVRHLLAGHPVRYIIHDLTDVPFEECVRRDTERGAKVGRARMAEMNTSHENARNNEWQLTARWMSRR